MPVPHHVMSAPIFTPFVMDAVTRAGKRPKPTVAVPRRLIEDGEKRMAGPSGLLMQPVKRIMVVANRDRDPGKLAAAKRPNKPIGTGDPLVRYMPGHPTHPSFAKTVAVFPPRQTKRAYFPDEESIWSQQGMLTDSRMEGGPAKMLRNPRTIRMMPGPSKMYQQSNSHNMHEIDHTEVVRDEIGDGKDVIDILEEDDEGDEVMHGMEPMVHEGQMEMNNPVMKIRSTSSMKHLSGENHYLKDQLDAALYRTKQLEMLLLDRNQRIKQLLKENLQMGVKMRKLIAEIGEDQADELLNPQRNMAPISRR